MLRFGMVAFCTEYSVQPAELAQAIEDRGLDAFYVTEHTPHPDQQEVEIPGRHRLPERFFVRV